MSVPDPEPTTLTPVELHRAFRRAVNAGLWAEADRLLPAVGSPVPPGLLLHAGRLHASLRRWSAAADLLAQIPDLDDGGRMLCRLARNLADAETHRPTLYAQLIEAVDRGRYAIAAGVGGQPIVILTTDDGRRVSLTANNDPAAAVRQVLGPATGYAAGPALGLLGIGDGHVLNAVARKPPELFLGGQQVVHLLEPDPQLVLTCMMMHDYAGPDGPIRQPRVRWHVGADGGAAYAADVLNDLMLPPAQVTIAQGMAAPALAGAVRGAQHELDRRLAAMKQEVDAAYADVTGPDLAHVLRGQSGRRPRLLLLTTRFSTVLQHSTRDSAEAAEHAGWDARVWIEPTAHHRGLTGSLLEAVHAFRPDVVFQLDHLRHEHGGLFPPGLPFVCWIQDHLPNLTNPQAGAAVAASPTDFVLAEHPFAYAKKYGYPIDRCLPMPKLTRAPERPARWATDGEDLVYVSNASTAPEALLQKLLAGYPAGSPAHALFAATGERILDVYRRGGCLSNRYEVQRIADEAAAGLGLTMSADTREKAGLALHHPLNNALYRQQALGWAAAAAGDLGLSLGLYGNGWDQHPTLGKYARGPVGYGKPLEDLTRQSKINLQVVPYFFMHQRLLDGLAAGGFFLVRLSATDLLMRRLHAFLTAAGLPASVAARQEALAALDPAGRAELETILADGGALAGHDLIDPIELVRSAQASGLLRRADGGGELIPHLDRTGFRSADELTSAVRTYLADEPLRRRTVDDQWAFLEERFTYRVGMSRMTRWLAEKLVALGPLAAATRPAGLAPATGQANAARPAA